MSSCAATTRSGARCRRKPADGGPFCRAHAAAAGVPLSDEDRTRLLDLLRAGVPDDLAVQVVGVPFDTFTEWLEAGAAGTAGFVEFAADVETSRGEGETRYIAIIAGHAKKDWRAGTWLLSLINPDRYGQHRARPDRPDADKGPHASDQAGL